MPPGVVFSDCGYSGVLPAYGDFMAENSFEAIHQWQQQSFPAIAAKCEGALAIFVERPGATLVRVSNIRADDWGVTVTITCVPLPGMSRCWEEQTDRCDISASWEIFFGDAVSWRARYVPWQLYFVPEAIDKFIALAGREAESGRQIDFGGAQICILEDAVRRHSLQK